MQSVHLILHQGDQRRDNQRRATQHHRRQLIAERFAAAGGHDNDGILPFQDSAYDFRLTGAKTIEAEMLAQGNEGIVNRRHTTGV